MRRGRSSIPTVLQAGIPTFLKAPLTTPTTGALKRVGAKVAVLGMPFDGTSIYRTGSSLGPRAIRLASEQCLSYHEEFDVDISRALGLVDCGDVAVVPGNAKKTFARCEKAVSQILAANAIPLVLGGEHSVTIPPARALAASLKGKMGLISFDSHYDTARDVAGELLTHCAPITRVAELEKVNPRNIVLVGIHGAMNPVEERLYVKEHGIKVISIYEFWELGAREAARRALELASEGTDAVYLSIDVDVLDAAYAPGTGTPEPGGMTSRELLEALRVVGVGAIGAVDAVEVAPQYDLSGITAKAAVRALVDILAVTAKRGMPSVG